MRSDSSNDFCELGVAVSGAIRDHGDLACGSSHEQIGDAVHSIVETGAVPLVLGGDHAISYPVIKALSAWRAARGSVEDRWSALDVRGSLVSRQALAPLHILHFDAHTDTYDSLDGNPLSHACPMARVCELPPPQARLLQVGIRTLTPLHRAQAEKFAIRMVECRAFPETRAALSETLGAWLADHSSEASPSTSAPERPRRDVYIVSSTSRN